MGGKHLQRVLRVHAAERLQYRRRIMLAIRTPQSSGACCIAMRMRHAPSLSSIGLEDHQDSISRRPSEEAA